MSENEERHDDRRRARAGSVLKAAYNKFKSRSATDKIKSLIQASLIGAVGVGSVVGVAGYAQASAAQDKLSHIDLGQTVITVPTPADLAQPVKEAKTAADQASASADEAKTQAAAALAAIPQLKTFADFAVPNPDPWTTDEGDANVLHVPAGTYVIDLSLVSDSTDSVARLAFSDGRYLQTTESFSPGVAQGKAIMTFADDVTATLQADSVNSEEGPTGNAHFSSAYALLTKVQGN